MSERSGFDRLIAACAAVRTRAVLTTVVFMFSITGFATLVLAVLPTSMREGRGSIVPLILATFIWLGFAMGAWVVRKVWQTIQPRLLAEEVDEGVGLGAGDVIKIGKTVEIEALDTPGHTMSHVCLLTRTDQPALICGDTLFNAGAGNCHHGGHPNELYDTFANILTNLPDETLIYPGHDYMGNNLGFTLDREPDNTRAKILMDEISDQDPNDALVSTMALEKEINTFLRLRSPSVIAQLRQSFPELPDAPEPREVFVKLRELRNDW